MKTKLDIAKNWLPRYTGTNIDEFGDYLLLTNFQNYVDKFAEKFGCEVNGIGRPMQTATNSNGLSIINFGIGVEKNQKRGIKYLYQSIMLLRILNVFGVKK